MRVLIKYYLDDNCEKMSKLYYKTSKKNKIQKKYLIENFWSGLKVKVYGKGYSSKDVDHLKKKC